MSWREKASLCSPKNVITREVTCQNYFITLLFLRAISIIKRYYKRLLFRSTYQQKIHYLFRFSKMLKAQKRGRRRILNISKKILPQYFHEQKLFVKLFTFLLVAGPSIDNVFRKFGLCFSQYCQSFSNLSLLS